MPTNWTEEDASRFEAWLQARLRQLIKDQELPSAIALFEEFELEHKLNVNKFQHACSLKVAIRTVLIGPSCVASPVACCTKARFFGLVCAG